LTTLLQDALNINQLIVYGLLVTALLLLFRLKASFSSLDRIALYSVAIVCTLMQVSAWSKATTAQTSSISHGALLTLGMADAANSQLYITATNKLLAVILEIIVIGALFLMGCSVFLHLMRQYGWVARIIASVNRYFPWIDRFVRHLDHMVVLVVATTCVLLQLFFGEGEGLLADTLNLQGMIVSFNQIVILLLILVAIIALFRLRRPFGVTDRLILLIDAIACLLLFFTGPRDKHVSLSLPSIQHWIASPHLTVPSLYIAIGLLLAVLVSFVWLKRPFPATDRSLLLIVFGFALVCALLQMAGYFFLLAALIVLLHGVVLAKRVEEVN
jgi:hypothetical protein